MIAAIDPYVNFANYDNWKSNSGWQFSPDNYVDMIYVIYRSAGEWFTWQTEYSGVFKKNLGKFTAIASLGIDTRLNPIIQTNEGTSIHDGSPLFSYGGQRDIRSTGITVRLGMNYNSESIISLLAHEMGHYLFFSGHIGGDCYGIMSNNPDNRGIQLSSIERERLGYLSYSMVYQDNQLLTLGDAITTGQDGWVLLQGIPYNPSLQFLFENHQMISPFDGVIRGGQYNGYYSAGLGYGKGIYIFSHDKSQYGPTSQVKMKNADGSFNWEASGSINMPSGWPNRMPLLTKTSVSRFDDKHDRNPHTMWHDTLWAPWHKINPLSKQWELTRSPIGDENDSYRLTKSKTFSPWTNPSSNLNGIQTNVGMEIISEIGNNVTIKVKTSSTSNLSMEPSKPQLVKVTVNANFNPIITWTGNIEPDLAGYKVYKSITSGTAPVSWSLIKTVGSTVTSYTDIYTTGTTQTQSQKVFYAVKAYDTSGKLSEISDFDWAFYSTAMQKSNSPVETVGAFNLLGVYPNPFNPETKIAIQLPEPGLVNVVVVDLLGQVVFKYDYSESAGKKYLTINGSSLASGVYFAKVTFMGVTKDIKLVLLR